MAHGDSAISTASSQHKKTQSKWLGRRSLRVTILTAFTTLFVAAVAFIVFYSYRANSRAILENADDLFDQATRTVVQKTVHYLKPAAQTARMGAGLVSEGSLKISNPEALRQYLVQVVRAHPQIVMFYFTHRSGNHLGIERKPDGQLDYWDLRREGAGRSLSVFRLTRDGWLAPRSVRLTFDFHPRTRPWFRIPKRTGRSHWTDAYGFFSSKNQLGITVSYPAVTREGRFLGVMAADIELEQLSRFVSAMRIGRRGRVLIVDSRDQLIAYPDFSKVFRRDENRLKLRTVRHLGEPWITAGITTLQRAGRQKTTYEFEGQRYIISQQSLPRTLGAPWRIVVVAPEDDFVGTLKRTNRNAILVAVIILLLGILIIAGLSKRISRPIVQLAEETRRIKEFDLEGRPDIRSPIAEIQLLDESVGAMKSSLMAFGRFVPAELVRQLLATQQEVSIGGEERELTIFFSDIKDFTALSEKMAPKALMEFVSVYLDELSRILAHHGATIDKYIGDAIMAFWNAPLSAADHAARGCRAALAGQRGLEACNVRLRQQYDQEIITRMGVHTGRVVVGNIGSAARLNYTALGDNVNLASRLEGANKAYGTRILVSETTARQAGDEFVFRIVDRIVVKGRREPVTVFELLGEREGAEGAAQQILADRCREGFSRYLARDWDAAIAVFEALKRERPDDLVVRKILTRCRDFQVDPPGAPWQGERQMHQK